MPSWERWGSEAATAELVYMRCLYQSRWICRSVDVISAREEREREETNVGIEGLRDTFKHVLEEMCEH